MTRARLRPALVLTAALLAVAVIATAAAGLPATDQNNPSSRSAGKLGTLALYTWFQDLGLQVRRVAGAFDLSAADMLVVYEPTVAFTAGEAAAVMRFVRSGGDAVLVTDVSSITQVTSLYDSFHVEVGRPLDGGTALPAQLFDATGRVRTVPIGPGYSFAPQADLVPLLESAGDAVAAALRVGGGGRVYAVGTTLPFSNDGLRSDDSPYFLLSLLQRARGGRIAFDEFHHGEGGQTAQGAGAIFTGPIGVAAALLAVVVLLALALNGRRLGRPIPAGADSTVPSAADYVRAMGQLFSRTRNRGAIAERYADELKRRAGAMAGIDPRLDDAAFVERVRAADPTSPVDALQALLRRLRTLQDGAPDERQLLRAARDVDDLERAWLDGAQLPR